jgi:hypothetical protein
VNPCSWSVGTDGLIVPKLGQRFLFRPGVTVTDAQMATVHLTRHEFHGDWDERSIRLHSGGVVSRLFPDEPLASA